MHLWLRNCTRHHGVMRSATLQLLWIHWYRVLDGFIQRFSCQGRAKLNSRARYFPIWWCWPSLLDSLLFVVLIYPNELDIFQLLFIQVSILVLCVSCFYLYYTFSCTYFLELPWIYNWLVFIYFVTGAYNCNFCFFCMFDLLFSFLYSSRLFCCFRFIHEWGPSNNPHYTSTPNCLYIFSSNCHHFQLVSPWHKNSTFQLLWIWI